MDKEKAAALTTRLVGAELNGWKVEAYRNHGKSAAVFTARKDGQLAAIKIFDTELVERYGDQTQLQRIERELSLRGLKHENLVSIYDGGHDQRHNLYFVVMEFLDGPNLKEALATITPQQIPHLVRQLASAARFLETHGIVHRDIKPENVALLDDGRRLVLLDLGVIRPLSGSDLTDPEGILAFIGTLQYSSPEFLLREEVQDEEGYRALTFYQIGAVMHDLIVKKPIFERFANPFAKLVNAVQKERPEITSTEVPDTILDLARNCLLKNPKTRLRFVRWESFEFSEPPPTVSARERVADKMMNIRAQSNDLSSAAPAALNTASMRQNVLGTLILAARLARAAVTGLPPVKHRKCEPETSSIEFVFDPHLSEGFPHGLVIRVHVEIVDAQENVVACSGCAYFPRQDGSGLPPLEYNAPWYEGVLEQVSLHKAFDQFFFQCAEWCLQVSPGVDGGNEIVFRPA